MRDRKNPHKLAEAVGLIVVLAVWEPLKFSLERVDPLAVLPVIRAALEVGRIDPPTCCSICLVAGSPDWRAADAIVFHDEDYANPLGAYMVCKPCHRLIHLRFWRATEWIAHVALHVRGGAWFDILSMDSDSRTQPFAQTYP